MTSAERVGQKLRQWRESKGVSQTDVAKALGITQPLLSGFEAGKVPLGETSAMKLQVYTSGEIQAVDCVRDDKRAALEGLLEAASSQGAA